MKKGCVLKGILLIFTILSFIPDVLAITVTPVSASIPSPKPGEKYSFILTLINDEASDVSAELVVDRQSFYLEPYVEIAPQSFTLAPNEKINVEITLQIPADISPEEHRLYIVPISSGKRWSAFEVYFTIPGEQIHNLTLKKLTVSDTSQKENLYLSTELFNPGNVIARAVPHIEILKGDTVVDTIEGKNEFLVLPGKDYNVTLLYDPRDLSYGFYKARVYFTYNSWRLTNSLEDSFQVTKYSDLDSAAKKSEVSIKEGESLQVEMAVSYGKRTDYRLKALVEDTDILLEQEGTLEAGEQKILSFELPTETLNAGTYVVKATVLYGEDFNQKAEKTLTLHVEKRSTKLRFMALILLAFVLLGVLAKNFIFSRKTHSPKQVHTSRKSWKRRRLERKLLKVEKRYAKLESEIRSLVRSTQDFINESNASLREKSGGKYEFK